MQAATQTSRAWTARLAWTALAWAALAAGSVQPAQAAPAPGAPYRAPRVLEAGAQLRVPFYLGGGADLGVGVQGRFAWRLPFHVVPQLHVGYARVQPEEGGGSMERIHVGAGARVALPLPWALTPFVGAGLNGNFWNGSVQGGQFEPDPAYRFALGVYGQLGVSLELFPWLLAEGGFQVEWIDASNVFDESQLVLSPWLGAMFYY